MSKELWCQVHEELVAEYLDAFPNADWTTAYESTAEMVDALRTNYVRHGKQYGKDRDR
jgi:hypothetical protein